MKKLRRLIVFLTVAVVFSVNVQTIQAKEIVGTSIVLEEGITSEGVAYTVYLIEEPTNIYNPNIVVSKKFTIGVTFDGNIVPPSTWSTTIQEGAVSYSGVLYLGTYSYDNFLTSKKTVAQYSGTLCGLL